MRRKIVSKATCLGRCAYYVLHRIMISGEKYMYLLTFRNKTMEADGSAYEDLFSRVMSYYESDFRQVKPQGSLGDKKNDGFIPTKGIYFQVYAPENICVSEENAVKKLLADFEGLMAYWPTIGYTVKEFNYVVNDKFKGLGPAVYDILGQLKKKYPSIKFDVLLSSKLQQIFEGLEDSAKAGVVGFCPSADVSMLSMDVLNSVVTHIMRRPSNPLNPTIPVSPDLVRKVEFNGLNEAIKAQLISGIINENAIEEYFAINNDYQKDELRDRFNTLYRDALIEVDDAENNSDAVFAKIYDKALPLDASQAVANAVIALMSYYFECCDIFKSPEQ